MDFTEDISVSVCQKNLRAANLARLLAPAEDEAQEGRTRPALEFLKEFKRDRAIQS